MLPLEQPDTARYWGVGEVLKMALPTAAGMVNGTILTFLDSLLVTWFVGPEGLSAQFVAGIYSFIPISFFMGVVMVVNTYISQNLGAGRPKACGQYAWQGLYLAILAGVAVLPLAFCSNALFGGLAHLIVRFGGAATTSHEIFLQSLYFRYLICGAALSVGARVLEQFFYGTGRPGVVYAVSGISVAVNLVLAYVLITGAWGFPRLGLEGAAIATLIGWALSFFIPLAIFLNRPNHEKYHTRTTWQPHARMLGELLKVGSPAGVQFFNDIAAWSLFISLGVSFFGEAHTAASSAVMRYLQVSFMPAVGVGIACTALVGRYIGQGRPDLARRRAHAGLLVAMAYMGLCGLIFLLFRQPLMQVFASMPNNPDLSQVQRIALRDEVVRIGSAVMICAAVFQVFDAVGITMIGALRGAGDTMVPMLVTLVLSWTLVVGGSLACVNWLPGWTSVGPWIMASLYVVMLGLIMTWRFESGAWRKFDLLGKGRVPPLSQPCPEEAGTPGSISGPPRQGAP